MSYEECDLVSCWWRVEVTTQYGTTLVAIEPGMMAGKCDLTKAELGIIRRCAEHLLGFVGPSDA